jgi:signal transduction histidine kinase
MRVRLHTSLTRDLPQNVAAAAYAIVSEAVVNAYRHADATEVVVHIADGPSLLVEVIDNGNGIGVTHTPGVGLRSMAERAADLGGTCVVHPAALGGTALIARLPFAVAR